MFSGLVQAAVFGFIITLIDVSKDLIVVKALEVLEKQQMRCDVIYFNFDFKLFYYYNFFGSKMKEIIEIFNLSKILMIKKFLKI